MRNHIKYLVFIFFISSNLFASNTIGFNFDLKQLMAHPRLLMLKGDEGKIKKGFK